MKHLIKLLCILLFSYSVSITIAADDNSFVQARESAKIASFSLSKVQRWLHEKCLPAIDQNTGLYKGQSPKEWSYRDTAADCYPFVIWAAYYTDLDVLNGPMKDILRAEQKICNHIDRLPVDYDLINNCKMERSVDQIIFGASEYVKDGLVAVVELTGRNEWYDRLKGIIDDIFKNAQIETPYGKIPSKNIEVNGELLQILPRLYTMTGEQKYLDWAYRLADYYLKPGGFVPEKLSDHGCEIIGGLGLLFAVESTRSSTKFTEYEPHLRYMFDEILRRGTNSDGIIIGKLQDTPGPHDNIILRDGWGYDYVAYLDYDMAVDRDIYRDQIKFALSNLLKPRYKNFNWDHNSRDNIADSVEGGLYLLNRIPVAQGFQWADREIATVLVDTSEPLDKTWLWDTHKLESNTVRTVLIHAMLHTQNTIMRPWRQDLQLGAAPTEKGIVIVAKAGKAWSGKLEFDIPRHRIYMNFTQDWPRMNTMPEWFTVEPDKKYRLLNHTTGSLDEYSGEQLHKGVSIHLEPGVETRLELQAL